MAQYPSETEKPKPTLQFGDAEALIGAAQMYSQVDVIDLTEGEHKIGVAAVPKGRELKSLKPFLDECLDFPRRKTGSTMLTQLDALCDFVNRHKTEDSIVFVNDSNPRTPQICAVFNPHKATARTTEKEGPDWQDHKAVYNFPLSDEYKAWTTLKESYSQVEFAQFLEDRIADVVPPGDGAKKFATEIGATLASAQQLLALSRGLSVNIDAKHAQKVDMGTGELGLQFFEEQHKDATGAPVAIPGAFAVGIPVFRLGKHYQIPVRLRYRLSGGRVSWMLAPQRLDKAFELAIDEAAQHVGAKTGIPVYRGAP